MAIQANPLPIKKRRSNKLHTARAVEAVEQYLDGSGRQHWKSGNTEVLVQSDTSLVVSLFDVPILELKSYQDQKRYNVIVHGGGFYDNDGNPSRMTQERLNGLLDCLEARQIIPDGIRVYKEKESGVCVMSNSKDKVLFNKNYCKSMKVKIEFNDNGPTLNSVES